MEVLADIAAADRSSDRRLRVAVTDRDDGDVHPLRVRSNELRQRQVALTGGRWAMASQVHGAAAWWATADSDPGLHPVADIVVLDPPPTAPERSTAHSSLAAIAVWTADCASLLLATDRDRLVGVHAGWRGLAASVVDRAVEVAVGDDQRVRTVVAGPAIGPCCYEFSPTDLALVAAGVGASIEQVAASTDTGRLALDVGAAVDAALERHGLTVETRATGCTGCDRRWFSHRARVDVGRHALVGWWT